MNNVEVITNITLTEDSNTPTTIAWLNEYKANCIKTVNFIIDDLAKYGELDSSIKKVIITDNYETAVQEQADLWNVGKYYQTKGRGYLGVGRIIYNQQEVQPERYVFIPSHLGTEQIFPIVLYGLILEVYSNNILPRELQSIRLTDLPWTFHNHIETALPSWIKTYWTRSKIAERFDHNLFVYRLPDDCFDAFNRDLKQLLFEYNCYSGDGEADNIERISIFWDKLFFSTEFLITGLLEAAPYYTDNLSFKNLEIAPYLNDIVLSVKDITQVVLSKEHYSIDTLKSSLHKFYKQIGVNIIEHSSAIEILLVKNPKRYTKGEIIDVEPRFVCFMDILGFSAMVDEYDEDSSTNILQKLQAAFKEAMQVLTSQFQNTEESEIEYLEYRVFSDCICISLPYFENEVNYTTNLMLLLTYVRGLQIALMTRGVFTRGGIAAGPYYMDENILFSKAMIRAYIIESKEATHPRIVLDKAILKKLNEYSSSSLYVQSVLTLLINDANSVIFLNPFNSVKNSIDQFKRSMASVKTSLTNIGNEDDELTRLTGNFAQNIVDWSLSLVENSLDNNADETIHELIRKEIQQQRCKLEIKKSTTTISSDAFKILEKSLSKYDWLEKFMNWATATSSNDSVEFEYYKFE
ncbi:hypothetical protein [Spirosoma koreense]